MSTTRKNDGFTLLELLIAVSLLAVATTVAFVAFSTVTRAWRRGMELTDRLHHGDYVAEQLVMALRSAYYPQGRDSDPGRCGLWMENNGSGQDAADMISWVKLGGALVGRGSKFADTPHRVQFTVDRDEEGEQAVMVKAWRLYGQSEEFDPEVDVDPVFISHKVLGFDCRVAYELVDDEIDWLEEWEYTNQLPTVMELSIYLPPLEEGGEPVEIKRIVGLPVAYLAWAGGAARKTTTAPKAGTAPREGTAP